MEIVESQFLNGWFFRYLKVSGIYFYGQPKVWQQKLPLAGRKRDFVPDMLQAVSAVCCSLLIIAMLADYALFYLEEIQTYDFFVVVAFINRIHYSGQVPLIFLACFVCRHRIRKLLRDVSVMASETMSLKDLQIWRNRNSAMIVMWLALCHGFHLLFISLRTIGFLENANDTVPIFGNKGSIRAPTLIFSTLSSASVLLSLNVDLAVQVFYFSVILIMIRILHNVHQVLAQLSGHDAKVTVRTEYSMVDWAANVVIRMRQLYKRLNRAFGYIIFLNCMRDLTAMVALMSVLLETDLSVRPGETPQQHQKRASVHDLKQNIVICEFFISISNAILRWTICAYSHKQVP
ncbi:hypothetical protein RvY_04292 [Ramazzottius varieornatus]|uniref:Uncharacterized protein n=1 Tax=Ramazzottius varieornatus TaxID=947166 RepID=A0A1D1UR50_RAMVA|nr:hypothetical protein RvY_04292 [Ramazzottius varieornatus]